jgi:hypothetical protein
MNSDLLLLKAWQDQQKTQVITLIKSFPITIFCRCYSEQNNKIALLFYGHRELKFSLPWPKKILLGNS